jgi:integrase/recombinase XerC/integrase/recombinase XerD
MRTAILQASASYLQERNDAMLALMYDTGLRVGELVDLNVEHLREHHAKLYLPTEVQKDYPNENSPPPKTLTLASNTTRALTTYLNTRWKDPNALFPSRSSERISEQGVRDVVTKAAVEAGVRPYKVDGTRGEPSDISPHALRHGVAYRMMNHEDRHTLYDVRTRLRHRSIQTTERIYDHIIEA